MLEGIATSGKTSVKNELEKILTRRGLDYTFIGEEETLMPLLQNTDPVTANDHITGLLNRYLSSSKGILIFDRLYLTHIWRTRAHIEDFTESASLLLENSAQICFLEIPNNKLEERILWLNPIEMTSGIIMLIQKEILKRKSLDTILANRTSYSNY